MKTIVTVVIVMVFATTAGATILAVPFTYPSIGEAIAAATAGDTIQIAAGTYYEHLSITIPLNLTGASREGTVIDGSGVGDVVHVSSSNVCIQNVTIQHGGPTYDDLDGPQDSGLKLYGVDRCYVYSCWFKDNEASGLSLASSRFNVISGCLFTGNRTGVFFYEAYESLSGYNYVNEIRHNVFSNQSFCAIWFGHAVSAFHRQNVIAGNTMENSNRGLRMIMCDSSTIIGNRFADNAVYGAHYWECTGGGGANVFCENNFLNSSAVDGAYNMGEMPATWWFSFVSQRGNYYSDYSGEDADQNGIGDTPYYIEGEGDEQDIFPLMLPNDAWGQCIGVRGNIDGDVTQQIDIADLIYLVAFMFQDGPPPVCNIPFPSCPGHYYVEADVNGDGTCGPDIADLIHLVAFMFQEGPLPAPCP